MRVAVLTTYAASRKEPLAALLERVGDAFAVASLGEPSVRFTLSDAPIPGSVSSVERVLKRFPELGPFATSIETVAGDHPARLISNGPGSPRAGEGVAFSTLLAVAAGVPRSFPFHGITINLHVPAFGDLVSQAGVAVGMTPGVTVTDSWWVNGRMRSLVTLVIADADAAGATLPPAAEPVAAILSACGRPTSVRQIPIEPSPAQATSSRQDGSPMMATAVRAIVQDHRARLVEIVERAGLPHDLPSGREALSTTQLGLTSGPRKPALARAFSPLGYDCHGGSGTFTLRRTTPGHLTVEISLDVGTWSHSVTAHYSVHGLGFSARLPLPVSRRAMDLGQYPIGGPERWQQIVDNLASLAAELDRTFVPAIEAVAGPTPEWYRPER